MDLLFFLFFFFVEVISISVFGVFGFVVVVELSFFGSLRWCLDVSLVVALITTSWSPVQMIQTNVIIFSGLVNLFELRFVS